VANLQIRILAVAVDVANEESNGDARATHRRPAIRWNKRFRRYLGAPVSRLATSLPPLLERSGLTRVLMGAQRAWGYFFRVERCSRTFSQIRQRTLPRR